MFANITTALFKIVEHIYDSNELGQKLDGNKILDNKGTK